MKSFKWTSALLAAACLAGACAQDPRPADPRPESPEPVAEVTALGRLEPGLGVVEVGAPAGDRILAVEVREGDEVQAGRLLVVLESRDVRRAELERARAARGEAEAALERARRLGPVTVEARRAAVERLEADLRLAQAELGRTRQLVNEDVLPIRELDVSESVADQARARLLEAERLLEETARRTALDVRTAEAALARAEAEVSTAERHLELTEIRSPVDGAVLDLRRLPGEATGGGSILTLGEISEMRAVAEIYEADARFVRVGRRAEITSPALPEPLTGTVETVGRLVRRNDVLDLDPAARTDVRVLETRIRLDDPRAAAPFVHLQVDVRIETGG